MVHVVDEVVVSSCVMWGGQRKVEREVETVYGGSGHSGMVLVLLLGLWAFVFDKIVNGIHFFFGRKIW